MDTIYKAFVIVVIAMFLGVMTIVGAAVVATIQENKAICEQLGWQWHKIGMICTEDHRK